MNKETNGKRGKRKSIVTDEDDEIEEGEVCGLGEDEFGVDENSTTAAPMTIKKTNHQNSNSQDNDDEEEEGEINFFNDEEEEGQVDRRRLKREANMEKTNGPTSLVNSQTVDE